MEDRFHLGVKALLVNARGELLVLKVNPAALRHYDGEPYWDLPGGRVARGDTIRATLEREVREETGLVDVRPGVLVAAALSPLRIPLRDGGDVGLVLFAYRCEVDGTPDVRLSDEHLAAEWVTPGEAAQRLTVKYPPEFARHVAALAAPRA